MSHTASYFLAPIATLIIIAGCSSPAASEQNPVLSSDCASEYWKEKYYFDVDTRTVGIECYNILNSELVSDDRIKPASAFSASQKMGTVNAFELFIRSFPKHELVSAAQLKIADLSK